MRKITRNVLAPLILIVAIAPKGKPLQMSRWTRLTLSERLLLKNERTIHHHAPRERNITGPIEISLHDVVVDMDMRVDSQVDGRNAMTDNILLIIDNLVGTHVIARQQQETLEGIGPWSERVVREAPSRRAGTPRVSLALLEVLMLITRQLTKINLMGGSIPFKM